MHGEVGHGVRDIADPLPWRNLYGLLRKIETRSQRRRIQRQRVRVAVLDLADRVVRSRRQHDARKIGVGHRDVRPQFLREHLCVGIGVRAEPVQERGGQLVAFRLGNVGPQQPQARVVEAAPVRQPLGVGVARLHAIDRVGQGVTRGDIHQVEHVLLRARGRQTVEKGLAAGRDRVEVERPVPAVGRGDGCGVDEQPLGSGK